MEGVPPGKRRLAIFDFDGTLVNTPEPEHGRPQYTQLTNKPWEIKDKATAIQHGFDPNFRRFGWWGRPETLQAPLFKPTPDKLNPEVAEAFRQAKADPSTYTIVMTGRHSKLEPQVRSVLNGYGLDAEDYYLKGQSRVTKLPGYPKNNDTLGYKKATIANLVTPEIEEIEMWDDRADHVPEFVKMGSELKNTNFNLKRVVVHDVKTGKTFESP
jgi:hypothetical protein